MNQIQLVALPDDTPTAYMSGGATRHADRQVPHLSQVMTVGRIGRGGSWRLSRGFALAFAALQAEMLELGEPVRLSDAYREPTGSQAVARIAYDRWVDAGRPEIGGRSWTNDMKNVYVARPGESNHGWGGAIDLDVAALYIKGFARGSDETLAQFWKIAAKHGITPIITEADVTVEECWHFEHLGPLAKVVDAYRANGYRRPAGYVARVGCALAGTIPSELAPKEAAYVQARLLIAGHFAGVVDGQIGDRTRSALKAAGITATARTSIPTLVAALNERSIGLAEIEQL